MLKFSLKLFTLLLCILALTLSNFAQTSKGFITGSVADQNGAAVPGQTLSLLMYRQELNAKRFRRIMGAIV